MIKNIDNIKKYDKIYSMEIVLNLKKINKGCVFYG